MKEKILNTAFKLYSRFGIKSISMDTVAQEIGASKKTLYQWYENKDQLVEAALIAFLNEVKIEPENTKENSVTELVKTLRLLNQKVAGFNACFFSDLKKYHSKTNQILEQYVADELRRYFIQNLKSGISQGLYRPDIHPEIIADLCIANFSMVVDQDIFPAQKVNQQELRFQVFSLFLQGIVTSKGRAFLPVQGKEK